MKRTTAHRAKADTAAAGRALASHREANICPHSIRMEVARGALLAVVLARIEGPRLLRHPAFLAGGAISIFFSVMMARDNIGGTYQLLMGPGLLPIAAGTLVAANLATLRSLRSDTSELQAALPARPLATTLGHLLSLAWAVGAGAIYLAAAFILTGAADGLEVDSAGGFATPSVYELAQGPATIATFGALGVALARRAPQLVTSALVVIILLSGNLLLFTADSGTSAIWLAPVVNTAKVPPGASWPCYRPAGQTCTVNGFHTTSAGWHLLYLAGLVSAMAALAIGREANRRLIVAAGAASLAVVARAATLQLP